MKRELLTVSQVAALTHLTVRALHHYDGIGLLKPSRRSAAGYRLYAEDDLRRLRQALLFRELGFGLDAVRALLAASQDEQRQALLDQRAVIVRKQRHVDAVLRAVDATLDSFKQPRPMSNEKLFEGFEKFENGEYAREAGQRWGNTDAWKESRRRMQASTPADRAAAEAEQLALVGELLTLRNAGHAPDSAVPMALAERHRLQIDQRYDPCSHEMQCALAGMYEADPRFRDHYDRHGEGLTDFLVAAIRANAAGRD
ncbi:MAG: MerR family transcriptional regulator [Arenimonas sp.]